MHLGIILNRGKSKGETLYYIGIIEYIPKEYRYTMKNKVVNKNQLLEAITSKKLQVINIHITSDNKVYVVDLKSDGLEKFIKHILKECRAFFEATVGTGTDLCGSCIEASELIVALIKYHGYHNCKTVEGWCSYDDDSSCSDRPYDDHTWVEIENGQYYIDITADQFNYAMYEENEYPAILFRKGLPHGMCYEEPEGWTDEDEGCPEDWME